MPDNLSETARLFIEQHPDLPREGLVAVVNGKEYPCVWDERTGFTAMIDGLSRSETHKIHFKLKGQDKNE